MNRQKKKKVIYSHNRILFSLKKKGLSDRGYGQMNLEDMMLREISQSVTKRQTLYVSTHMRYLE